MINLGDLEVASSLKKRARTERGTTPSKTITRCTNNSEDNRSQQGSETNAVKHAATADVEKTKTKEAKKGPKDMVDSGEEN